MSNKFVKDPMEVVSVGDVVDVKVIGIDLDKVREGELHREYIEEKTEFVTRKQIASYAIVSREYLKHSGNLEITNKLLEEYILTLIDLYSPKEIEKQAEVIKEKNN